MRCSAWAAALVARAAWRATTATAPVEHNANASVPYGRGARIEKAFTIECSADELYAYWRDFTNLPTIMSHLESVDVLDDMRSHWTAKGPGGVPRRPGTPRSSTIRPAGASRGAPSAAAMPERRRGDRSSTAPGERGTELRVEMEWAPPGGPLGTSFAHLLGDDPGLMVETDLRRFKATMEAGYPAINGTDVKS